MENQKTGWDAFADAVKKMAERESTQNLIERVARTINPEAFRVDGGLPGEHDRDRARQLACEIMDVVRDPTAAMLALCEEMAGNELCWDADEETIARVYRAMIDAGVKR